MPLFDDIESAAAAIRARFAPRPRVGVVLGSGLGDLAGLLDSPTVIPGGDIPHFPRSTVESHAGDLVGGTLAGQTVVALRGRFHAYEGYTLQQVTLPVRVMKALGCEVLLLSNACGGLNPQYRKGDIMLIEDHINLMGDSPLIGPNDERLGPRFPDMCFAYDRGLLELARRAALDEKVAVQQGVYAAVTGPNLETRAEYRALRALGADVVGMSTVPEAIVAAHAGLRTLGFSVVTDMCLADALEPVSFAEILAAAAGAEPRLRALVRGVVARL